MHHIHQQTFLCSILLWAVKVVQFDWLNYSYRIDSSHILFLLDLIIQFYSPKMFLDHNMKNHTIELGLRESTHSVHEERNVFQIDCSLECVKIICSTGLARQPQLPCRICDLLWLIYFFVGLRDSSKRPVWGGSVRFKVVDVEYSTMFSTSTITRPSPYE